MYINFFVILNLILLSILILILIYLVKKNSTSIIIESVTIEVYITLIAPLISIVINFIANSIFKPNLIYWLLGFTPLLIPLVYFIYLIFRRNNEKKVYNIYYEKLSLSVIDICKDLDINIRKRDITITLDINKIRITSRIIINVNEDIYNNRNLKKCIEEKLTARFNDMEIVVSFVN